MQELTTVMTQSPLPQEEKQTIIDTYQEAINAINEIQPRAKEIQVTDIEQKELMKQAKELRESL